MIDVLAGKLSTHNIIITFCPGEERRVLLSGNAIFEGLDMPMYKVEH